MRTDAVKVRPPPGRRAQAAQRYAALVVGAVGLATVVVLLDSTGVVSDDVAVAVDNAARLGAAITAAVACAWTARRRQGPERAWRSWMALGMTGWAIGQAIWSYHEVFADVPLPSPSAADVGYLTMPAMAVPALLSLAVAAPRHAMPGERYARALYVLDGLVVVGSLFVLTWATSLGTVVRSETPTGSAFAVAVAYPLTDLCVVVVVVLLAVMHRVPRPLRAQMWLLASGLVAIAVSDSILAHIVAKGLDEMPPVTDLGFVLGPILVAIAALAAPEAPAHAAPPATRRSIERAHLLLPYVLVVLTGAVMLAQGVLGADIDPVEAGVAWVVLGVVLMRQMITLLQNTALLERVSTAQEELSYRAHHDPLTGLANRALFNDQLAGAVARHEGPGLPFALLLIDLDDFKTVNDTLGHAAGDQLLMAIGDRLRGCVRQGDMVARLGGDEFAIVLEAGAETPSLVAERVLAALSQPFHIHRRILTLGGSVGIVEPVAGETGLTPDELLHRADGAMYAGKRRGKGQAVHWSPGLVGGSPDPRPQAPRTPVPNAVPQGARPALEPPPAAPPDDPEPGWWWEQPDSRGKPARRALQRAPRRGRGDPPPGSFGIVPPPRLAAPPPAPSRPVPAPAPAGTADGDRDSDSDGGEAPRPVMPPARPRGIPPVGVGQRRRGTKP